MDRKKHPFFLKPFRTPTMRSKPHHEGQNLTPELQPPARERLPYRQNLGMSSRGPDGVANRSSVASLPVDDVPFDDFDRDLLAQLEDDEYEDRERPPVENRRRMEHQHQPQPPILTPAPRSSSRFNFESFTGAQTTPLRGQRSSSSDTGFPSSPTIGMAQQRDSGDASKSKFWGSNSNPRPHLPLVPQKTSPDRPDFVSGSQLRQIGLGHAPPMVQGIRLVSAHELPDRFRSVFSFPVFNAIQSKCFPAVYNGSDNIVLSAPTGSGKTVVMELAICRQVTNSENGQFKVVYQAPTKSLCSERFRDWQAKFSSLGLQCAELTGDTDHAQLRSVQSASIIITTPEKWDSMTRKWKDHTRLMQLVKLSLIDEVHILKETRGATLEAVVSRMKSAGSNVRFIALSATVPNSEDIATWLGKDPTNQHLPAHREKFGEEFRPVKLQKFVYGYQANGNDFAFDKVCGSKLPEVISKHSSKKPIMIFCCTRNSAITTCKNLANMWSTTNLPNRLWDSPKKSIQVHNQDLKSTISSGVAFHHAGLDAGDRHTVEMGFLEGHINVICCTSTLAVGVNLPCHLVIVKNTVTWQDNGCREYADLEMMQMLGRAGRPQFDDSAVAVILTRKERVDFYERMVSGSECLESCLHLNLIDHLNAEIGLGTVSDISSATKWLAGTFFFVRLRRNPGHYKLKEDADRRDEDEMLRHICEKDIGLLQECNLIATEGKLKSTEFGDAMARYYVKYETMKILVSLEPKAKISEILSVVAQGDEFREIRLKAGEKSLYKEINKANGIRFPIKVDISLAAHKISLLIQSELGGVEFPAAEQYQKHRISFQQEKGLVFSHVNRLIRCIIDCQIHLEDAVSVRNALELARSFGAKVWDNSPLQMKQIEQIGIVAVRKLANAGINTIEMLETTEAHRIDMILSKNPPFGMKLLGRLEDFPKLRVLVKLMGKETKPGKPVRVNFKADIGFINEKAPLYFHRRPVYVCFLAETSDGRMIDFRRMSASKLQKGHDIFLSAQLNNSYQYISCYVTCDDIAGTMRQAELKPNIAASLFPTIRPEPTNNSGPSRPAMNTSRRRSNDVFKLPTPSKVPDEFSDDIFDDGDFLAAAESTEFIPIEDFDTTERKTTASRKTEASRGTTDNSNAGKGSEEPRKLDNGKWACNHRCKDKTLCKHLCCREGTDKPPKSSKKPLPTPESNTASSSKANPFTSSIKKGKGAINTVPKAKTGDVETLDLTERSARLGDGFSTDTCRDPGDTERLSFFDEEFYKEDSPEKDPSSDYGASWMDDIPSPSELLSGLRKKNDLLSQHKRGPSKGDVFEDPLDLEGDTLQRDLPPLYQEKDEQSESPRKDSPPSLPKSSGKQISSISPPRSELSAPERSPSSGFFVTSSSSPILYHKEKEGKENWMKRPSYNLENQASTLHKRQKYDLDADQPILQPNLNLPEMRVDQEKDANNSWEDIDPSLLEEFKDLVDFL